MKIIFAGTPHFAASALEALISKYRIVAVLTQPDRPSGRGMQLTSSPVKQLALQHNIPVMQPHTLKTTEVLQQLAIFRPDVMVVAAYGLILPQDILNMPSYGCLNIHASLLPRWRGAAPIQRAILAGDDETGITIMQMDQGLDTGAILYKEPCRITQQDTAQTLHDKLAKLGAEAIVKSLEKLEQGDLLQEKQDDALATYAAKLTKIEAQLDWTQSAVQLERAVRAYIPFPIAFSIVNGTRVKVWQASVSGAQGEPGTVLTIDNQGIQVACGKGSLYLEVLQRPNGKAIPAAQFVQGFMIKAGDRFSAL